MSYHVNKQMYAELSSLGSTYFVWQFRNNSGYWIDYDNYQNNFINRNIHKLVFDITFPGSQTINHINLLNMTQTNELSGKTRQIRVIFKHIQPYSDYESPKVTNIGYIWQFLNNSGVWQNYDEYQNDIIIRNMNRLVNFDITFSDSQNINYIDLENMTQTNAQSGKTREIRVLFKYNDHPHVPSHVPPHVPPHVPSHVPPVSPPSAPLSAPPVQPFYPPHALHIVDHCNKTIHDDIDKSNTNFFKMFAANVNLKKDPQYVGKILYDSGRLHESVKRTDEWKEKMLNQNDEIKDDPGQGVGIAKPKTRYTRNPFFDFWWTIEKLNNFELSRIFEQAYVNKLPVDFSVGPLLCTFFPCEYPTQMHGVSGIIKDKSNPNNILYAIRNFLT